MSDNFFDIDEELKKLPGKPGVYIMHDVRDSIIYVGKAISLKNRVRQYFQKSRSKGAKIDRMVSQIARFEYIITDSEVEALVLECNLIKEHRPKYNTLLKDDKTYPYIKVTVAENFPRVLSTRTLKKDKSRYFGPYTSPGAVNDTIELIRKLYRIRTCNRSLPKDIKKDRPCLNYHIGQCDAPCQGKISAEDYRENIRQVLEFLNGNYKPLLKELEEKMYAFSEKMEYEKAIEYRELLNSVKKISQKQKITSFDGEDKDVVALAQEGDDAVVQVFFIRGGRMIGREHFYIQVATAESSGRILTEFVKQFYSGTPMIPKEIMLQEAIEDMDTIEKWLSARRDGRVHLRVPTRGTKEKLVELAAKNAGMVLMQDKERIKREEGRTIGAVREIQKLLGLEDLVRIEAFDISNISGFESVGSMIVYEKGKPCRHDYRKFKIKTVQGPNDYASMQEVLTRRFEHGIKEKEDNDGGDGAVASSFTRFPSLIMMDGGKGQVNIAEQVISSLNLDIPVCGMVKDDHHRTRGLFYHNEEIPIDRYSEGFKLITRIQDEAHRFAIEYHRSLRDKTQVRSVLDDIPGIGPARRKSLMKTFGSIEAIMQADTDKLSAAPSMNVRAAEQIYNYFHSQEKNDG